MNGPGGPPCSPGVSAWPMKYVEYGIPEQNATRPFSSHSPSDFTAISVSGCATEAQMNFPSPKTSSCVCCGNQEPTISAWFDASARHQPVDGQPREISAVTPMNVGTSPSSPP